MQGAKLVLDSVIGSLVKQQDLEALSEYPHRSELPVGTASDRQWPALYSRPPTVVTSGCPGWMGFIWAEESGETTQLALQPG